MLCYAKKNVDISAFLGPGRQIRTRYGLFATETRGEALALIRETERITGNPGIAQLQRTPWLPRRVDGVTTLYLVHTSSITLAKKSPDTLKAIRAAVKPPKHPVLSLFVEETSFLMREKFVEIALPIVLFLNNCMALLRNRNSKN